MGSMRQIVLGGRNTTLISIRKLTIFALSAKIYKISIYKKYAKDREEKWHIPQNKNHNFNECQTNLISVMSHICLFMLFTC